MRRQRKLLLTFITIALCLSFLYFVPVTCSQHPLACLGDPTAPPVAPYVYRILQPTLETFVAPTVDPFSASMLLVDELLQVVVVVLTIPALYSWLKRWLEPDRAVIGVFIFSVINMVALHLWFRALSISLEVLVVVWGLALIERRWWYFVPLIVLASFNRETGVILAGIYAAYHGYKGLRPFLALLIIWGGITAGLHLIIGPYPHVLGLEGTLQWNLANLSDALLSNLLLVPLALAVAFGYRSAPAPLRRLCWVACLYILAIIVGASWNEAERLVLPLLPLVIPIAIGN